MKSISQRPLIDYRIVEINPIWLTVKITRWNVENTYHPTNASCFRIGEYILRTNFNRDSCVSRYVFPREYPVIEEDQCKCVTPEQSCSECREVAGRIYEIPY